MIAIVKNEIKCIKWVGSQLKYKIDISVKIIKTKPLINRYNNEL